MQDLQRDDAIERALPRLIDDAHATASDAAEDLELGKACGDR
jgi:hypothetical protein